MTSTKAKVFRTPIVVLSLLLAVVQCNAQSISSVSSLATSVNAVSPVAMVIATTIDSALPQTAPTSLTYSFYIPDLSALVSTVTTASTVPLDSTYSIGATPTIFDNAPAIPTSTPVIADYPPLDKIPDVESSEVLAWVAAIDFSIVPDYSVTTGACSTSVEQAAEKERCWWTCGTCTRSTDVTDCPDKYTWGTSFDDGPSPWTPLLLDYLNEQDITTTFFVVGSRVLSRPEILRSEYMAGHQIAVHTWSHPNLTTLTNEQIVAELGWTKKVIKETIGVTPAFFRPPYGDIDDRVRAIAAQMDLTPIIWTVADKIAFDTTDFSIASGSSTGESALSRFENLLATAKTIDTGFIVLEHDLYAVTVDLAVGYILPMALNATNNFNLMSINECLGWSIGNAYVETNDNSSTWTNVYANTTGAFPNGAWSTAMTDISITLSTGIAEISQGATATDMSSSSSSSSSSIATETGHKSSATKMMDSERMIILAGMLMLVGMVCTLLV